jgi:glycosyltransferase involved in cell wall biosynthesis
MYRPTLSELPPPPLGKVGWPWTEETRQLPNVMLDGSSWPRVTIVTPSYNQAQFLEETIRSVLLQGYPDLEYFVMDGGSTDGSVQIIQKYAPWLAGWVSEKDQGQADAINKGWQRSTGDLLGWLNSDDMLTAGSIAATARTFKENSSIGFVFGDLEVIDAQGELLRMETHQEFDLIETVRKTIPISQPGSFLRRTVFERTGLLDSSLHFMMDFDYWLRAGLVCRFGYLRQPVASFRQHDSAKSSSGTDLAAKDILTVYHKFYSRSDLPAEFMRIRQQAWSRAHLFAARAWYGANCLPEAWSEMWAACWADPGVVFRRSFRRFLPYLLFVSLVGGRRSRIVQSTRHMFSYLKGES